VIAQALEADVADRARAREALEIVAAFRKAGHDLDESLRLVAERGRAVADLLAKLHRATGSQTPSWDQLDALGYSALQTAIARTPWARRFRPIAPSERRDFGPLFSGWATVVENRLRPLLTESNEEAA
jgi:hypothetical protein